MTIACSFNHLRSFTRRYTQENMNVFNISAMLSKVKNSEQLFFQAETICSSGLTFSGKLEPNLKWFESVPATNWKLPPTEYQLPRYSNTQVHPQNFYSTFSGALLLATWKLYVGCFVSVDSVNILYPHFSKISSVYTSDAIKTTYW